MEYGQRYTQICLEHWVIYFMLIANPGNHPLAITTQILLGLGRTDTSQTIHPSLPPPPLPLRHSNVQGPACLFSISSGRGGGSIWGLVVSGNFPRKTGKV